MRETLIEEIYDIFDKYDNDEYKNDEMEQYASEVSAKVYCYDGCDLRNIADEILDRLANIFVVGNSLTQKGGKE